MNLIDLSPLVGPLTQIASELKRLREILEPQIPGSGNSFRTGYEDPSGTADGAWIGSTDEVRAALREQIESYFGRPLTHAEEREHGFSTEPEPLHEAFGRIQGARRESGPYYDGFSPEPPSQDEDSPKA